MRAQRAPRSPLTSSLILKKFAKIALNHKIEEVVEIEVNWKIEEEHKIEEVVKIVVNCKIVEEVFGHFWGFPPNLWWSFGLFCASLRRFLQAGSTFCGLFSQISFGGFLLPFLRSIFDPFLAFAGFMICLFCGTFWPSKVVFGPFWDPFWDVHLAVLLDFLGPGLLNRLHVLRRLANQSLVRLIQGSWMAPRGFEWRICTLLALAFAIFFTFLVFGPFFSDFPRLGLYKS
jgi:hypothetical protein